MSLTGDERDLQDTTFDKDSHEGSETGDVDNPFDGDHTVEIPEKEKQNEIIQPLLDQYDREGHIAGESYYLISILWWKTYCDQVGLFSRNSRFRMSIDRPVGPIDNSNLVDKEGNLLATISESVSFTFLPASIWNLIHGW